MTEYGRLSRSDRLKLSGRRRTQFALALAFLLLILVAVRIWWPRLEGLINPPDYGRIQAVADSLILQAGRSFALSDSVYVDSLLNQVNPREENNLYRRYGQPWPGILPFEFYAGRLQELSREKRLVCKCEESSENHLTCAVGVDDFCGAVVLVKRSAKTRLAGRKVAFLINNLGALDNSQIMKMVENGLDFSYMATPDVYPSAKIKRALEGAGVTSILEIPSEIKNVADFPAQGASQSGNADLQDEGRLAASLFERQPNPVAIIVKRSGRIDSSFVTKIIEQAKSRKVAFIYENRAPDFIDSLAYSGGLVILNMKNVADFSEGQFSHNRSAFLREMILSPESAPRIALFEGSAVKAEDLLGLQRSFQRLGVKLMDSISLMEIRESL